MDPVAGVPKTEVLLSLLAEIDRLNPAHGSGRSRQPQVAGEEDRVQGLSERDIHGVPSTDRVAQLPRPVQEQPVSEAFTRPCLEILNCLGGFSAVQPATQMLTPDHPKDLDVHNMRCSMIGVGNQPFPERLGSRCSDQDPAKTGGVND